MKKLTNLMPLIRKYFPDEIKLPAIAEARSRLKNRQQIIDNLEDVQSIWGSDCSGGLAYFGKKEDIEKIHQQTQNYLLKAKTFHVESQFYILWELGEYSLLTLYEDYAQALDNPYPAHDGVLCVFFGAWTDDNQLFQVIHKTTYFEDKFSYEGEKADFTHVEQANLLEEMKKAVLSIDNSQIFEEDDEEDE